MFIVRYYNLSGQTKQAFFGLMFPHPDEKLHFFQSLRCLAAKLQIHCDSCRIPVARVSGNGYNRSDKIKE